MKRPGRTGEYQAQVVAVRPERSEVHQKRSRMWAIYPSAAPAGYRLVRKEFVISGQSG